MEYNYIGSFQSLNYKNIKGIIKIHIPNNRHIFSTKMELIYDNGKKEILNFNGSQVLGNTKLKNLVLNYKDNNFFVIKFIKNILRIPKVFLTFEITDNIDFTGVFNYSSYYKDNGVFVLHKKVNV